MTNLADICLVLLQLVILSVQAELRRLVVVFICWIVYKRISTFPLFACVCRWSWRMSLCTRSAWLCMESTSFGRTGCAGLCSERINTAGIWKCCELISPSSPWASLQWPRTPTAVGLIRGWITIIRMLTWQQPKNSLICRVFCGTTLCPSASSFNWLWSWF